ncbi:ribbon-helix-helix protein, CopG family [Synergistes jonesii]|uniref:ribbon-helix-helix protein, CopG family n=1 Tax=Synergistes jonesii TaxID=2754 RepID=UPI0009DCEBC0
MEKKQSTVINIRLDDDTVRRVDECAARVDRSRSNLIRHLILTGLDALQDNARLRPSATSS